MSKLKVGDRVRFVTASPLDEQIIAAKVGEIAEVVEVKEYGEFPIHIRFSDGKSEWMASIQLRRLVKRKRPNPVGQVIGINTVQWKWHGPVLGAKLYAAPPIPRVEQEPVAWVLFDDIFIAPKDMQDDPPNLECMKPLYANPLALREPTEKECSRIAIEAGHRLKTEAARIAIGRAMFNAVREVMTK